jgi:hypothetical protein
MQRFMPEQDRKKCCEKICGYGSSADRDVPGANLQGNFLAIGLLLHKPAGAPQHASQADKAVIVSVAGYKFAITFADNSLCRKVLPDAKRQCPKYGSGRIPREPNSSMNNSPAYPLCKAATSASDF